MEQEKLTPQIALQILVELLARCPMATVEKIGAQAAVDRINALVTEHAQKQNAVPSDKAG